MLKEGLGKGMILTKLRLALIILLTSLILLTVSGEALAQPQMVRIIMVFSKTPTFTQQEGPRAAKEIRGFGGRVRRQYRLIPAMSAEVPKQALRRIRRLPGVAFVEEDQLVYAVDAELDNTWGVKRIGAGAVHSYNKGTGIKVAIIDSGIDYNHPDLAANYAGGYDIYNNDNDPMDDYGHGTHVAGTVAALDNDTGVIGVAPEAHLYAIKVLGSSGSGWWSDVISGIEWAVANDMQVINMSLGSSSGSSALGIACDAAEDAGVVVVAAAGNSGNFWGYGDRVLYPAKYDSVIAVAATDSTDERAYFSSTGPDVELAAPGVNVLSTTVGGNYGTKMGTSMSSPHVVGLAALIIASGIEDGSGSTPANGRINDEVRERMQQTAIDLGTPGRDNEYGYGLVNAPAAVPYTNQPPVAEAQSVGTPEDTPLAITLAGTDPDGDPLTYSVVTPPSNGTLTGTAPDLTYTPDPGYLGSDSFTFKVNDGAIDSTTAAINITVNPLSVPTIRVYIADIFIVQIRGGWRTCAKAIISAVDNNEEPIENIRITAHWEGATTDTESGYTVADGTITFTSSYRRYPSSGTEYIIVIDTITLPTGYELANDSVLTGTVAVP